MSYRKVSSRTDIFFQISSLLVIVFQIQSKPFKLHFDSRLRHSVFMLRSGHTILNSGHTMLHSDRAMLQNGHTILESGHAVLHSGHNELQSGRTVLHNGNTMLQSGHIMLQCGHTISGTQSPLIQLVLGALSAKMKGLGRDVDPSRPPTYRR